MNHIFFWKYTTEVITVRYVLCETNIVYNNSYDYIYIDTLAMWLMTVNGPFTNLV